MNKSLENVLDKAHEKKSLKELIELSPAALQGVTDKDAEALKASLGIKSIRDLATNKFVLWAQAINTLAAAEK